MFESFVQILPAAEYTDLTFVSICYCKIMFHVDAHNWKSVGILILHVGFYRY